MSLIWNVRNLEINYKVNDFAQLQIKPLKRRMITKHWKSNQYSKNHMFLNCSCMESSKIDENMPIYWNPLLMNVCYRFS